MSRMPTRLSRDAVGQRLRRDLLQKPGADFLTRFQQLIDVAAGNGFSQDKLQILVKLIGVRFDEVDRQRRIGNGVLRDQADANFDLVRRQDFLPGDDLAHLPRADFHHADFLPAPEPVAARL
jgi:hypothetical protein